jgi:hypothetical protein
MFSKTDGPTALRADLLRALAFSAEPIDRTVNGRSVASMVALAGVWNGKKGYVAVLIRDLDPPAVERYVSDSALLTETMLDAAVEEGIAFAESFGFTLDAAEFAGLAQDARDERLERWNKLRKLKKAAGDATPAPSPGAPGLAQVSPTPAALELDLPELPPVPKGYEIAPDDLSVPAPTAPLDLVDLDREIAELAAAAESEASARDATPSPSQVQNAASTVLGRISLVRRGGAEGRRMELIARLLAFY